MTTRWVRRAAPVITVAVMMGCAATFGVAAADPIGPSSTDIAAVKCVQQALGVSGDGVYGPATIQAVRTFQSAQGVTTTGIVGPATGSLLVSRAPNGCADHFPTNASADGAGPSTAASPSDPATKSAAGAAPETERSFPDCPLLLEGQQSECVRRLQHDLNAVNAAYHLPENHVFGPATRTAVLDFQGRNHLPADGNVGAQTATLLEQQASATGPSSPGSQGSGGSTGTGSGSTTAGASFTGCPELRAGSTGTCVERLQRDLAVLDPSLGLPSTGRFGKQTDSAVRALQAKARLDPTGTVDQATADEIDRQVSVMSSAPNAASPTDPTSGSDDPVVRPASPVSPTAPFVPTPGLMKYAALGDSYSSGEGAAHHHSYLPGTDSDANRCHRSEHAYGPQVGEALGMQTDFRACSGATLPDYSHPQDGRKGQAAQSEAVDESTGLVTLSFGGNDIGFSDLAANCVGGKQLRTSWSANCVGQVDKARSHVSSVGGPLTTVLESIHRAAPRARILVIGYPQLFPDVPNGQCNTGVGTVMFEAKEMVAINHLVHDMDTQIRGAVDASSTGATYVSVERAFVGDPAHRHDECVDNDAQRWVNRAQRPVPGPLAGVLPGPVQSYIDQGQQESFHPTIPGQAAFRDRVLACLRDPNTCTAG